MTDQPSQDNGDEPEIADLEIDDTYSSEAITI